MCITYTSVVDPYFSHVSPLNDKTHFLVKNDFCKKMELSLFFFFFKGKAKYEIKP